MYIGLHIKYPLFLSDFRENIIFSKIFEKLSNIKFHENTSNGSKIVPCGIQLDRHGVANNRSSQFCERS